MIILGTKSKNIGSELVACTCAHCQSENSLWVYIYRHYFHLFWIPAFPLWKSASSQCTHCKQVLRQREFQSDLIVASEQVYGHAKTPWWMYFWLLLFGFLIVFMTITSIISRNIT